MLDTIGDWMGLGREESYPRTGDVKLLVLFALFFPTIRYLLDRFVFERAGNHFIKKAASNISESEKAAIEKVHTKFKESCWKSLYYLSAEVFALAITYDEPWFTNSRAFWEGPGNLRWPDQTVSSKLKVFYGYVGGFYTYSIFALIFWETRRKDFGVSMSHHLATVVLIVASYVTRFSRVCSMVVALHDASDVFLELAKLSKYSSFEIGANVNFGLFALTWLVLRLIYFPFYIIRSTSMETLQLLDRDTVGGPPMYYFFNTLLIMLFYLHIYWWILIVRVVKKVTGGKIEGDVRSDDEDDD
eukprot:jgi/Mesen1/2076/ME000151S01339